MIWVRTLLFTCSSSRSFSSDASDAPLTPVPPEYTLPSESEMAMLSISSPCTPWATRLRMAAACWSESLPPPFMVTMTEAEASTALLLSST